MYSVYYIVVQEHYLSVLFNVQNSTAKQKLEKLKIILSTIDSDEEEGHLQGSDISKEDDQFDEKVTSGDKQRKNAAKTDGDSTAFASQGKSLMKFFIEMFKE